MNVNEKLRPADENDYVPVFRWMVGKRLAYLCALLLLISGSLVLMFFSPLQMPKVKGKYRTFAYDSLLLKLYAGKAVILNSRGSTAYIGQVKSGTANGKGTLYRDGGSVLYQGEFADGKYDGEGCLYDTGNQVVFQGNFRENQVVYEELVGRPTAELAKCYQGETEIYSYGETTCTAMPEIEAACYAVRQEDSLEEEWAVSGVYVMKQEFRSRGEALRTTKELQAYFGEPEYTGTSAAEFQDVAAVRLWRLKQGETHTDGMTMREEFAGVYAVTEFQPEYELNIRAYEKDGFWYTFFGEQGTDEFAFYLIEKA